MLCSKCEDFDIRALWSLAERRFHDTKPSGKGFPEYEGFPTFYKHHLGLASLRASSENGCRLCKSIWLQFVGNFMGDGKDNFADAPISEQIYFGLSNWSPEAKGMPYLTVIQNYHGSVINLALFDVFAEQSKFPHDIFPRFL